jgi:hypothetical protein
MPGLEVRMSCSPVAETVIQVVRETGVVMMSNESELLEALGSQENPLEVLACSG